MYKTIICCVIKYCNTNDYKNQKKYFFRVFFEIFPRLSRKKLKFQVTI